MTSHSYGESGTQSITQYRPNRILYLMKKGMPTYHARNHENASRVYMMMSQKKLPKLTYSAYRKKKLILKRQI
jgi:hypothetical protein